MTKQNEKRNKYLQFLKDSNLSQEAIERIMHDQDNYPEDIKFAAYDINLAPILYQEEFGFVDTD